MLNVYGFAVLNELFVSPPGDERFEVFVLYKRTDETDDALLYVPEDHVMLSRYFTVEVEKVFVALVVGADIWLGTFATVTVAVASSPCGTALTVIVYVPVLLYDLVKLYVGFIVPFAYSPTGK